MSKQIILDIVSDSGLNFAAYDRRECEDLPIGEIQKALAKGVVTKEEILESFWEGTGIDKK